MLLTDGEVRLTLIPVEPARNEDENCSSRGDVYGASPKVAVCCSLCFCLVTQWEILTLLAATMGPAEVAAWGILNTIWSGVYAAEVL